MSLQATDQAAAAVQQTPNRVSLQQIEDAISETYFVNGYDAVCCQAVGTEFPPGDSQLKIVTLCFIVFKNGFVQIGYSAPADAGNFNAELGRKFAREHAIREAWPKFGFALRELLSDDAHKTLSPSIFDVAAAARGMV